MAGGCPPEVIHRSEGRPPKVHTNTWRLRRLMHHSFNDAPGQDQFASIRLVSSISAPRRSTRRQALPCSRDRS
ncbi:hypothetical protein CEP52_014546 [Fusarium oligoseptatum]|uniref:Uncharacterized protein n=2 Tax=Fusarium solani species complex TaxID=232080 RepID=A0A428SL73_9HYPO|nr:hypothetical protein CEP53_011831 [Fusarium sp. AF-6]RSL69111.1 hypothetical protein CEP51_012398 [Fusarium floridanum]RSL90570.1 hypothetical protein CEP52_014546 [Fusarium oligoseptatum]